MEEGLRGRHADIPTRKDDDTPGSSFGNGQTWRKHGGENGRREGESVACGWLREGVRSHMGMRRSGKAWTPQGRQCWACALQQCYDAVAHSILQCNSQIGSAFSQQAYLLLNGDTANCFRGWRDGAVSKVLANTRS